MTECVWMCLFSSRREKKRKKEAKERYEAMSVSFFHSHAYAQYINHVLTIAALTSRQGQIQRGFFFFSTKAH